jgi:hypothetical protein
VRKFWIVVAVAVALSGSASLAQVPPEHVDDPYASGARFLLAAWVSEEVRNDAIADGWAPVPLLTHRFYFDADADAFDGPMYAERIWWPEWTAPEFIPGAVQPDALHWEKFGIPTDNNPAAFTGWADIDLERYAPVRFPEDHPPQEVLRIASAYLDVADATRAMRPHAKLILHGLVNKPGSAAGRAVIEYIVDHYDAISPSVYPHFTEGFANFTDEMMKIHQRLQFCEQLRETHGVKIYPILWKRYTPIDHGEINPLTGEPWAIVMNENIARAVLIHVAMHDVDGVIVFGPDGRNHFRVEPNWPPDTPTPEAVDETTRRYLDLVREVFGD